MNDCPRQNPAYRLTSNLYQKDPFHGGTDQQKNKNESQKSTVIFYPLFDTLAHLTEPLSTNLQNFLQSLAINEINKKYALCVQFLQSYAGSQDTFVEQLCEKNPYYERSLFMLSAFYLLRLRHTAISNDVEFRPREHVRDDAGHGSNSTTGLYIDIDRRARHDSAKNKTLNPLRQRKPAISTDWATI